jgi:hypothetical protein
MTCYVHLLLYGNVHGKTHVITRYTRCYVNVISELEYVRDYVRAMRNSHEDVYLIGALR